MSLAARQMHGEAWGCAIHPSPLPKGKPASHLAQAGWGQMTGSGRRSGGTQRRAQGKVDAPEARAALRLRTEACLRES